MGLLSAIAGDKDSKSSSNGSYDGGASNSNSEFSIGDPNLRKMAEGDVSTIVSISPINKLTESAVNLKEKEAKEWQHQEQLHGRAQAADTQVFSSHARIAKGQFEHGEKRIKAGLNARDSATKFGEKMYSEHRPRFVEQNYRLQLGKVYGEQKISRLGEVFDQSVEDLRNYQEVM